jgi:hypothetical protein
VFDLFDFLSFFVCFVLNVLIPFLGTGTDDPFSFVTALNSIMILLGIFLYLFVSFLIFYSSSISFYSFDLAFDFFIFTLDIFIIFPLWLIFPDLFVDLTSF